MGVHGRKKKNWSWASPLWNPSSVVMKQDPGRAVQQLEREA